MGTEDYDKLLQEAGVPNDFKIAIKEALPNISQFARGITSEEDLESFIDEVRRKVGHISLPRQQAATIRIAHDAAVDYHLFARKRKMESAVDGIVQMRETPCKASPDVSDYLKSIAPRLDGQGHKGMAGRICVLGGSIDYAGAPFYAGMAALRVGAELLYLCTASEATGPIKSYSPELMVSEIYRWSHMSLEDQECVKKEQQRLFDKMEALLPRLHAMTIGPGLGRDDRVLQGVRMVIRSCNSRQLPLVIDADGLWLIEKTPEILEGYSNCVLTPNAAEFRRLAKALTGSENSDSQDVCDSLKGPIVLQKGPIDRILAPGKAPLECDEEGAPRRPGGLGDFLAGSLAVFLGWAQQSGQDKQYACMAACTVVRQACRKAYVKKKRAMVAPDVLEEVAEAFDGLCPAAVPKE